MGTKRNNHYRLPDGIYLSKMACFVHTVAKPLTETEKKTTKNQEAARKNVERAFGELRSKWNNISRPRSFWSTAYIHDIMQCCIILHKMCVEDREEANRTPLHERPLSGALIERDAVYLWTEPGSTTEPGNAPFRSLSALFATSAKMRDHHKYITTRALVMDHLWKREGFL